MKKLRLVLVGEDYEKVEQNFDKLPKWDCMTQKELECVFLDIKKLTSKKTGQPYNLYIVVERHTKTRMVVMPNKVLQERLNDIPIFSAVKMVFDGVIQPKGYYAFSVYKDRSFKYNADVWNPSDYAAPSEDTGAKSISTNTNTSNNSTQSSSTPAQSNEVMDDLPF